MLLVMAWLGVARADLSPPTSPAAKAHNDQGNRYYKVQEFEKAIVEYQKGAEIEDTPIFLYNLGQCHRQLGNYDKAIWFYQRYLSSGPVDDQVAMYVRDFIKVMKAKKEQELKDKPPVEPEPRGSSENVEGPESPANDVERPRWYQDGLGWGIAGGGLLAVGVGGGLLLSASSLESDADAEPDVERRRDLRDSASTRRTTGVIMSVIGATALVVGVTRLVLVPRSRDSSTSAWIMPIPQGLAVVGRF